jgi:hypothetical protein
MDFELPNMQNITFQIECVRNRMQPIWGLFCFTKFEKIRMFSMSRVLEGCMLGNSKSRLHPIADTFDLKSDILVWISSANLTPAMEEADVIWHPVLHV